VPPLPEKGARPITLTFIEPQADLRYKLISQILRGMLGVGGIEFTSSHALRTPADALRKSCAITISLA
jgi:hypothetical protein